MPCKWVYSRARYEQFCSSINSLRLCVVCQKFGECVTLYLRVGLDPMCHVKGMASSFGYSQYKTVRLRLSANALHQRCYTLVLGCR